MNEISKEGYVFNLFTPTFENVTRLFITRAMKNILFSDEIINFNFVFKQEEAIRFVESVLSKYTVEYDFFAKTAKNIIDAIKKGNDRNNDKPSLIINDYKIFFELLRRYYEKYIELYFQRTNYNAFQMEEMENCFEHIWLRMTPNDFNNPESFLLKSIQIINDTTFDQYNRETLLGLSEFLGDNVICVKNRISRTWDEAPRQFETTIYSDKYLGGKRFTYVPHYTLPVIRYGIYEKNGKKVCYIGAIQNTNKKNDDERLNEINLMLNEIRSKLNSGATIRDVEPNNLLSLSIFINFLHSHGITEIEVPSMYVLDYEYHEKRDKSFVKDFQREWPEERKSLDFETYEKEKAELEKKLNKQDTISLNKTERFIKLFMRLLSHYTKAEITSYPGELDSFLHMNIPVVLNDEDINNDVLREMNYLVQELYKDNNASKK